MWSLITQTSLVIIHHGVSRLVFSLWVDAQITLTCKKPDKLYAARADLQVYIYTGDRDTDGSGLLRNVSLTLVKYKEESSTKKGIGWHL